MMGSAREQALRTFSDQFDTEGPRIVYRQNQKGAPIPVSAEERDGFVAAFDRAYRLLFWSFVIGTTLVALGLVVLAVTSRQPLSTVPLVVVTLLMAGLLTGSIWWNWNAPARALAGRMASGKPLSKIEVRRRAFSRMPYSNFLVAAGAIVFLYFRLTEGRDLLAGWNLLWSILAVAGLVGVGVQVFRKWSAERSGPDSRA